MALLGWEKRAIMASESITVIFKWKGPKREESPNLYGTF
jgi:hypothetical protein